jgi:filamentous hemagglutinin family protein
MKSKLAKISPYLTLVLAAIAASGNVVRAQTITPAPDGTGTIVMPNGDRIDIKGGSLSRDGANLFHSFSKFGISPQQIANFLSNPSIRNILGRITGGDPSVINGLIRVSGGNANLFLMNPSGIVFGNNARLDLRGSFTATTANGIGFGDNWFSAMGANDYANLLGTPTTFAFNTSNPGSIINTGDLTVGSGQNLTLLGGTVVSTGNLSAPDGNITVSAVPGENLVRLTPQGNLLSLEIQPLGSDRPNNGTLPVAALPQLLTGGNITAADGIRVNASGQVELTSSGIDVNNGDVVANTVNSRQATLSANRNLTLVESQIRTTGDLNLLAGNTVFARDSAANPFIALAGGRLLLQGNQKVDLFVLSNSASGLFAGENMTLRSANTIQGDARYSTGGNFRIEKLDGSVGNLFSPYDPAIFAAGDVTLGDYTGASLGILAGGRVQLGNVIITGPDTGLSFPDITFALPNGQNFTIRVAEQPALVVLAGMDLNSVPGLPTPLPGTPSSADITTGSISITAPDGVVFLSNTDTGISFGASNFTIRANNALPGGNIQTGDIDTRNSGNGGNIFFSARQNITTGSILANAANGNGGQISLTSLGGNIDTSAGILDTSSGSGDGGAISLKASGNITTGILDSTSDSGLGGNITVTSTGGAISTLGDLRSYSSQGNSGSVALAANGNVTTRNIYSASPNVGDGNGGRISITSQTGGIDTTQGIIWSFGDVGAGGDILLAAFGTIQTGEVNSSSLQSNAGNITLTSRAGAIEAGDVVAASDNGNGGTITLTAPLGILVSTIDAQGGSNGTGGNVTVTTNGFFRAIGSFIDQNGINASISTAAGSNGNGGGEEAAISATGGGDITIRHGGNGSTPFIVGNASTNGTQAAITSGTDNTIFPTQSFLGNFTQGNIQIITGVTPPPPPPPPPTENEPPAASNDDDNIAAVNLPINIKVLANDSDPDGDNLRVISVTQGANGSVVLNSDGTVTYIPNNGFFGTDSFTYTIDDGNGGTSTATVTVNVPPSLDREIITGQDRPPLPQNRNPLITSNLDNLRVDTLVGDLDAYFTNQFNGYFKRSLEVSLINLTDARSTLRQIEKETGVKPAIIYAVFTPDKAVPGTIGQAQTERDSDILDLVIVTGSGNPIRKQVPGATRAKVKEVAQQFYETVSQPKQARNNNYLAPSQQLYQWLIAPLDEDLQKQKIQNVMFISDVGLRSIPIAALHDGKQFAIEKYSIGLAPSLSLVDTRFVNIKNSEVLAMGAGEFAPDQEQDPLLAAPLEVSTVATKVWRGRSVIDRDFTQNNLKGQRQRRPYGIIHLATHADFQPGEPSNSYVQLYDMKISLDRARELGLNNPGTQLLVLSACRSALGDKNAELGFAGLSVQAGVKSALASLWDVSDSGALALMSEFYGQLNTAPIKAEALRQSQIAMIQGKVKIEGNELITSAGSIPLSPEVATYLRRNTIGQLSHPFYWASFTLVGSPW